MINKIKTFIIFLLGITFLYLCSSCNVVKKNSSSNRTIADSSVSIVKDSGRVVKRDSITAITKDSSAVKKDVSKDDNNIEIVFKPDSPGVTSKPVKVTKTDNGYEVDPGGRVIDKITVKETKEKSTTDSAGVATSVVKTFSSSDSNNLHEGTNVDFHKEDTANTTSKTSFRLPWYIWIIGVAGLIAGGWGFFSLGKPQKRNSNG